MIGLGTNRLNPSRLAGLGEARQFRVGQWLEGGGSWGSPYSAAATRALKAAFSAAQWATIRDYGFAHPEIVGYMNAYAVEDAKIAYSLVPTLGVRRWVANNGTAYIDTGLYITGNAGEVKCKCRIDARKTAALFGNCAYSPLFGIYAESNATKFTSYCGNSGNITMVSNLPLDTLLDIVYRANNGSLYWKVNETSNDTTYSGNSIAYSSKTFMIFAYSYNLTTINGSMSEFELTNGNTHIKLVPFIHKDNGVEYYGMIDLLTGTFYGDATGNNGFTISETPTS